MYLLSDKGTHSSKINLVNNDEVISDDAVLAETFSKFYEGAVKSLGIFEENSTRSEFESSDPVDIVLSKYANHPSVLKIKEFIGNSVSKFNFSEVDHSQK